MGDLSKIAQIGQESPRKRKPLKMVTVPRDDYNDDLHMINESDENKSSCMKEQLSFKDIL